MKLSLYVHFKEAPSCVHNRGQYPLVFRTGGYLISKKTRKFYAKITQAEKNCPFHCTEFHMHTSFYRKEEMSKIMKFSGKFHQFINKMY